MNTCIIQVLIKAEIQYYYITNQ